MHTIYWKKWSFTGINPWSSYFQCLFVWLILFPQRRRSSKLRWWYQLCSADKTNDLVIKEVKHFSEVLFKWFDFQYLETKSGRCHRIFSGNDNLSTNIDDHIITSENKNELLGIMLNSKLSFEDYTNNLCKKAT